MGKFRGIVQFICLMAILMTLYGFVTVSGIFYKLFTQIFADSSTWYIGLLSSLRQATMYLLAPLATTLCLRFGHLKVIIAGVVLSSAGVLISAFTTSIHILVISFGFITGLGICFMDSPTFTLISMVFGKRRNSALTMVSLLCGITNCVYPIFINFLKNFYGLWGTFIILAGLLWQSLTFCAIFSVCQTPLKLTDKNKEKIFDFKILKTKNTLLLTMASFCWAITLMIATIIPHQAILAGFSDTFSDLLVTYSQIGNALARVFVPIAVLLTKNRLNYAFWFGISELLSVIPIYFITSATSDILMITGVVLYGGFYGIQITLFFPAVNQVVGVTNLTRAIGFIYFGMGIGSIISSPIAGYIFDVTRSYSYATLLAIALSVIGGATMVYISAFFENIFKNKSCNKRNLNSM